MADQDGLPLEFRITGGHAGEYASAAELLDGLLAETVTADEGYDSEAIVTQAQGLGATAVIPPNATASNSRASDRDLYKQRNRIERCFNNLKHFRRLATR